MATRRICSTPCIEPVTSAACVEGPTAASRDPRPPVRTISPSRHSRCRHGSLCDIARRAGYPEPAPDLIDSERGCSTGSSSCGAHLGGRWTRVRPVLLRVGMLTRGEETGGAGTRLRLNDAPITAEDFRHNHDMEENATLLATSVKALLKRALAAMWESEKQLRTGAPRSALPWEYRALEALEEIRRSSRAYVKRIGFEPPAIDAAAVRLTRSARGLAALSGDAPVRNPDPDASLHAALAVLGDAASDERRTLLERAGHRLAARALDTDPGRHLETLAALRQVIDGCTRCADAVRAGILRALPVPHPALRPRRPARGALSPDRR